MATSEVTKTSPTMPRRTGDAFGAFRDEMEHMFDRFERGWPQWPTLFGRGDGRELIVPELDVRDDGKQLTIEVDLPGVEEKDVSVTLANNVLTIKGEKKSGREEKDAHYYMCERSYGAFQRSLRLPDTIDDAKLEARFDKGVLKVIALKKPEAMRAEKKIEIKKG